jgi:hypothetical protein
MEGLDLSAILDP